MPKLFRVTRGSESSSAGTARRPSFSPPSRQSIDYKAMPKVKIVPDDERLLDDLTLFWLCVAMTAFTFGYLFGSGNL